MNRIYKAAIIGGGASGLAAAVMLSGAFGQDVIVLERLGRVGKKITVTGNGRGNFTNENLSADNYHSQEGDAPAFVRGSLKRFGNAETVKLLSSLGALTVADKGRIYPASFQASSVLDLIRERLENNRAEVRTEFEAVDIKFGKTAAVITAKGGEKIIAEHVVLAAGGKCQKQFGTDGSGYALAELCGHTVTECTPSLVQLKTDTARTKQLTGIRQEAVVSFLDGGVRKTCEKGDVLFTEFGVSGNAVFQVSGFAPRAKSGEISLEFLPEFSEYELASALKNKIESAPYLCAEDILTGFVNKQLGRAIVARAGVNLSEKCAKSHIKPIIDTLKDFRLKVVGTLGFNYAQVTRGGVRLSEIHSENLKSKRHGNLYLSGEIIDIDGDCGGYNLQWAFTSAYVISCDIGAFYGKNIEI